MQKHLIPFHQDKIIAFSNNGEKLIAVKPICEAFQIDWSAQFKKIQKDDIFNSTIAFNATVGGDGKQREMLCLPLEVFPMWLAKIETRRIKNELAKEKIILYQKEAAKVLFEYFISGSNVPDKMEIEVSTYITLLEKHIALLESSSKPKRKRRKFLPLTKEDIKKIVELNNAGLSINEISRQTGRATATVHYQLKIAGVR